MILRLFYNQNCKSPTKFCWTATKLVYFSVANFFQQKYDTFTQLSSIYISRSWVVLNDTFTGTLLQRNVHLTEVATPGEVFRESPARHWRSSIGGPRWEGEPAPCPPCPATTPSSLPDPSTRAQRAFIHLVSPPLIAGLRMMWVLHI